MSELIRSNKVTARFEGEGIAVGTFYKTHDKLVEVKSNDQRVLDLGFIMPQSVIASEGVEPIEVTPKQKLDTFKDFLQVNCTIFGMTYDPIDRRDTVNKFPSKYTPEILLETGAKVLLERIQELVTSVQKHIDSLVKQTLLPVGSALACNIGIGEVTVQESYKNGNLKYADVVFPTHFAIGEGSMDINVPIKLVSGQIKKPRELNDKYVLTVTGLKTALIEAGILPKKEKEEKVADTDAVAENVDGSVEENVENVEGTVVE